MTTATTMIADTMAGEIKAELASTRKLFERLPEDKWDWKPHEKSMALGQLASHIAEILFWGTTTCNEDVYAMDPETYKPQQAANLAELGQMLDSSEKEFLGALGKVDDGAMNTTWKMTVAGKTVMEMPRVAVLRGMIFNHLYHHRGQLDVYARLLGVPLPKIYGPTADEPDMFGG